MSALRLALANLTLSPLTTILNVLLMALGTASIVLLLLAGSQLAKVMARDAEGVDLVLGAPGSPIQLILSAVYHADVPPGNIPLTEAQRWIDDPRIDLGVPLSLGDSFRGFRIVGTTPEYLDLYGAVPAQGRVWEAPMEAVLGASVGATLGLGLGDTFAGVHGLSEGGHDHEQQRYRVVGQLAPTGTVADRLVLTSLESVWDLHEESDHDHDDDHDGDEAHDGDHDEDHEDAHANDEDAHEDGHDDDHEHEAAHHEDEHHDDEHEDEHHESEHGDEDDAHEDAHEDDHDDEGDEHEHGDEHAHEDTDDREVTAVLLSYRAPLAALTMPRQINAAGALQAAAPAMEISRLLQLIGVGLDGLKAFAWVLIGTAALSIFAGLYGSLRARRGELAVLRCLGATRGELLLMLMIEGVVLAALGILLGALLGHGVMTLLAAWLEADRGVALSGWALASGELPLLLGLLAVGALSAIIPAVSAYRIDVARILADG
ncbi:MAG: ABC transporter permease [Pseudomonadota bacterium]